MTTYNGDPDTKNGQRITRLRPLQRRETAMHIRIPMQTLTHGVDTSAHKRGHPWEPRDNACQMAGRCVQAGMMGQGWSRAGGPGNTEDRKRTGVDTVSN